MKRIASFCVDHTKLTKGLYVSRIDGDVVTYDLRMCTPNSGRYLENPALHTVEHLLATYVRNSAFGEDIVYAGPMGCRTGFYLLCRDSMTRQQALDLIREAFRFIAEYAGEVPGTTEPECGNYREHDLEGAKKIGEEYGKILKDWSVERMDYDSPLNG